jgi:RNA polymerase sigma-70 factor (ECF subfamily)
LLDDREVIRRCQCGQTELIDTLIDRYRVALYSLCRRLTGERLDADDLFQDTWVRVIRSLDRCSPERKFVTWLYSICLNRYRDRYRKRRRWLRRVVQLGATARDHMEEVEQLPAPEPAPDEEVLQAEVRQAVSSAVQRLQEAHRLPVLLHYYLDLTVEETAEVMGLPAGTVKSRLHAGRKKIKLLMEELHRG